MGPIQFLMKTDMGPLYLTASEKGLQSISFTKNAFPLVEHLQGGDSQTCYLSNAVQQLNEYLMGTRRKFEMDFDLQGTDFQIKVWNELLQIPYGQTVTYQDIAIKIKNEKAVRAVGTANGRNPIWILIPCHRVITSAGHLGGYAGGLEMKAKLLVLEGHAQFLNS